MTTNETRSRVPLVTLSLDKYIVTGPTVSKEDWDILDATFIALGQLCTNEPVIRQTLSDLHSFCRASQETKEMIARNTMTYHFYVDNYIIMAMNNADQEKTSGFTTDDIMGFTLARKDKTLIHITHCMVTEVHRRQGYGYAMIKSLYTLHPDIERVTVDARADPLAISFFAHMGFVPQKNQYTLVFRNAVVTRPETLHNDPLLAPIRGPNETTGLIYYPTCCHTCKSDKDTKRCSRCKTVSYCCVKCQGADWKTHQIYCIPYLPVDINKQG